MIPARISIVTLGVRDLASMRAFNRGLGWEEGISTEGLATFRADRIDAVFDRDF